MNILQFKMNDLGAHSVKNLTDGKIPDVLSFFQNIFGFLINWVDNVFPLGTRMETLKNWILLAAPFVILGLVLLFCLPCLWFCFIFIFNLLMGIVSCILNILKGIWRYLYKILFCCYGQGGNKVMKAPGRNVSIVRKIFEANPAGYFQGLRAQQPVSGDFLA